MDDLDRERARTASLEREKALLKVSLTAQAEAAQSLRADLQVETGRLQQSLTRHQRTVNNLARAKEMIRHLTDAMIRGDFEEDVGV